MEDKEDTLLGYTHRYIHTYLYPLTFINSKGDRTSLKGNRNEFTEGFKHVIFCTD